MTAQPKNESLHFIQTWQHQLANAFSTIEALCAYLNLNPESMAVSTQAVLNFPIKVPLSFAKRMEKGNPHDPLLKQVLPISDELKPFPGFVDDPVGDLQAAVSPGLLHKYHGRVLLINTGTCAINCRYCFRRNFPYGEQQLGRQDEQNTLDFLRKNETVSEVILSGGDPLILSDDRLQHLFQQLDSIPHIQRIRIHSRIPIVLPARITPNLGKILAHSSKHVVLVVHCNHANEIGEEVSQVCRDLKNQGITLLNQAVLLKGINNDAETLCDLSERLFAVGILPYYLHQLDKAKGTGHFEVSDKVALRLMDALQSRLPGYLVPKLVKEVAGAKAKQFV